MIHPLSENPQALCYAALLPYQPTYFEEFLWRLPPAAFSNTKLGVGFEKLTHVEGMRVLEVCGASRAYSINQQADAFRSNAMRRKKLRVGDFLVCVNGKTLRFEMLEELRSGRALCGVIWRFRQPLPALEAPLPVSFGTTRMPSTASHATAETGRMSSESQSVNPLDDEEDSAVPSPPPGLAQSIDRRPDLAKSQPQAAPEQHDEAQEQRKTYLDPVQEADVCPAYQVPPWEAEPAGASAPASGEPAVEDSLTTNVQVLICTAPYDAQEPDQGYLQLQVGDRLHSKMEFVAEPEERNSHRCPYIFGWRPGDHPVYGGWVPVDVVKTTPGNGDVITKS